MPPKLSARSLFWWGAGVLVAALIANQVLADVVLSDQFRVDSTLTRWLSAIISALLTLGPTLIGGAFIVRALSPDKD